MSQPTCADARPVNPPPRNTELLNIFAGTYGLAADFSNGRLFVRQVSGNATRSGCAAWSQESPPGTWRYYRTLDTYTVKKWYCNGTLIRTDRWNSRRDVQQGPRVGTCSTSMTTTFPASAPAAPSCAGSLTSVTTTEYEYSDEVTKAEVEAVAEAAANAAETDTGWPSSPVCLFNSRIIGDAYGATGDWAPAGLVGSARRTANPGPLDRRVTYATYYYRLAGRASPCAIEFDLVTKVNGVETARTAQSIELSNDTGFEGSFTWTADTDEVVTSENLCISPLE